MVEKIVPVFLIIILFHIGSEAAFTLDARMESCIVSLMNQQYAKARSEMVSVLNKEPGNVDFLFMYLNVGQIEIVDYESYGSRGYRFIKTIDSVVVIIEKNMASCSPQERSRYLFYDGTIYMMKSLVLAKVGEWVKAVKFGHTAVKLLEEAREIDPGFIEPLYGIGLYNYYLGESLKWLPFMREKSKQGLADVERVAQSSSPMSFMVKNSLAWIYVERGKYKSGDLLVSSVLKQYPDNTIFLRIKARLALLMKKHTQAITLSKRLITLAQKRRPINWSDLIDGYQILVSSLDALHRNDECIQAAKIALSFKVPASAKKNEYIQKHLDYISIKKQSLETTPE